MQSFRHLLNNCAGMDIRSAKMYKNTALMIAIRGISMLLTLLSAPIMLNHVNRADYGVLLTLTSIVSWVGYMDVGLGNGLRNKIPEYLAAGDVGQARKVISSSYAVLAIYVAAIIVLFLIVSPHINWIDILNSPSSDAVEIGKLASIVFIAFCVQFLFGLVNSILFACQMPAMQSVFTFLGQLLSFVALLVQVYLFDVSSVFQIGAVNCLIPPVVLFLGSILLFRRKLRPLAPSIKFVEFKSVTCVLTLGIKFFVLQIISVVLFQANSIIIARTVSPEAVVEYNLAFKYISVLTIFFNIIVTPVWSATTDAYVRNDHVWIKKTLSSTRKICFAAIGIGALMVLLAKFVYRIWLGDSITIGYLTTGLIFLYISFEMLYKVYGTIINGIGKVRAQMLITGIVAIVYIPMAVFAGRKSGLPGVLIANTFVFLVNYIWSKYQCSKLLNNTASGIWNK